MYTNLYKQNSNVCWVNLFCAALGAWLDKPQANWDIRSLSFHEIWGVPSSLKASPHLSNCFLLSFTQPWYGWSVSKPFPHSEAFMGLDPSLGFSGARMATAVAGTLLTRIPSGGTASWWHLRKQNESWSRSGQRGASRAPPQYPESLGSCNISLILWILPASVKTKPPFWQKLA